MYYIKYKNCIKYRTRFTKKNRSIGSTYVTFQDSDTKHIIKGIKIGCYVIS